MPQLTDAQRAMYMPHRRQRPLSDSGFEYVVMESSLSKPLLTKHRLLAIAMGIIAGLSTVGTGVIMLPWSASESVPRVAGAFTDESNLEDISQTEVKSEFRASVCWNQAEVVEGRLTWSDVCRGLPFDSNRRCKAEITPLSDSELKAYAMWIDEGKPLPSGCEQNNSSLSPLER